MKLSNQALGAIMMALQKSLMERSDVTETLKSFDFVIDGPSQSELVVSNPPIVKVDQDA
tara:strand:- start:4 stop:180 length:177 start_codon:yes stop_codon:yes gene_type:complete